MNLTPLSSLWSRLPLRPSLNRQRVLGIAKGTRRYDLSLAGHSGNGFLRLLIALMTVLGMLALCSFFALSAMQDRWSSGLQDKASVEIPAADSAGEAIPPAMVQAMTQDAAKVLQAESTIDKVEIMSKDDIRDLLAPWLGQDLVMDSIPLPGLISVSFKPDSRPDLAALRADIREVAPSATIDGHEQWLEDVLRFTGALQFAASLIASIIALTTLVAVAAGVRSKLAENKEELELLHLMGASDRYIARQIQRHTGSLSLQGGIAGLIAGSILLAIIAWAAGRMGVNLIPDFRLETVQKIMIAIIPLPVAFLAMLTARWTVLRVLARMP